MPRSSFGTETAVWDQLAAALERYAAELPHLQEQRAQLQAALERVKSLSHRQRAQDARLRITTRELQEGRDLARALEGRLRAGLKQHFGLHSPRLLEFGGRPKALPKTPLPDLTAAGAPEPDGPGAALDALAAGRTDGEGDGSPN